ncbi:MAG: hypothetical protein ABIQ32_06765 [Sphingomicrobium sp.]
MTRRGVLGVLLGLVTSLSLSACGSTNRLRYKMTVEVDTPEGVKTGFAVREMALNTDNIVRPATGAIKGEAVAVDLPGGQTLFALLTGGDGDVDYGMQIGGRAGVWERGGPIELYPTAPKTSGLERTDPLPMLVRFRDLGDPKSVERVEPANLAASFGAGVRLRRITVETTKDALTTGMGKRLGWLDVNPEPRLDSTYSGSKSPNLSQKLTHGSFREGALQ